MKTATRELHLREDVEPEDYERPNYKQFVEDMIEAGLDPYHYVGRNFYKGPAVDVDDVGEAMAPTSVRCQFDGMGTGYVVYPL